MRLLGQIEDLSSTLRAISYTTAAGTLLAAPLVVLRGRIPLRVFAWMTVASAALLTLYVSTSVRVVVGLLQGFAPYGTGLRDERGESRAWTALAGLAVGLAVGAAAVLWDGTPDPPMYDDTVAGSSDAEASDDLANRVDEPEDGLTVTVTNAGAGGIVEVLGTASSPVEDEGDFDVPPLFPRLAWRPAAWRAQLPLAALTLAVAAMTLLVGELVASPVFSNGSTPAAAATPYMVLVGLLTGIVVLLPAWLHDDDVHPITAVLSLGIVATSLVLHGRYLPLIFQRGLGPFIAGIAAGTTVPLTVHLLGELRAQVARRDLVIGVVASVLAVATLSVGLAYQFEPGEQLRQFEETRRRMEQSEPSG